MIGLIPEAACERDSEWMRQLIEFDPAAKILEQRLGQPLAWPWARKRLEPGYAGRRISAIGSVQICGEV